MKEKGLLKEEFAAIETSLAKLTENVNAARDGAVLEDLNLTVAGLAGAEETAAYFPALPNVGVFTTPDAALKNRARETGPFSTERIMKKKRHEVVNADTARLREIADAVNPLGQLIKKNQQRAENKVVRGSKTPGRAPTVSGAVLERKYKGKLISVKVLEVGFEYESKYYKTLSSVAFAVTRHHLSGYHFFGL